MDVMCLSLYIDMTDDEIKDCIHQMMPVCRIKETGFCLTIGGFDQDSRDLWEIPEVLEFYRRLVKFGFISCLEVSTTADGLAKMPGLPGFGALEVWMCAKGLMVRGKKDVTQDQLRQFHEALEEANKVSTAILKEPCPNTGMRSKAYPTQVNDGPVRYTGFNKSRVPRWRREMKQ